METIYFTYANQYMLPRYNDIWKWNMESTMGFYQTSSLKEGAESPVRIRSSSPGTARTVSNGNGSDRQVILLNELSEKLDGYFSLPSIGHGK
jgi:hypothetical protein